MFSSCIDTSMSLAPLPTFNQYCIFATIGFSERKVKSLRFHVNGIGTMRLMKSAISNTRRINVCEVVRLQYHNIGLICMLTRL